VPFLQRLLTLNKVINNLPLSQGKSEDEVVQEVVKLADEMGLRIADFKDAIASPSSRQATLDQISEEGNFLSRVFGLKPGVDAVITNGQVLVTAVVFCFLPKPCLEFYFIFCLSCLHGI
jgi:hypothetical protein